MQQNSRTSYFTETLLLIKTFSLKDLASWWAHNIGHHVPWVKHVYHFLALFHAPYRLWDLSSELTIIDVQLLCTFDLLLLDLRPLAQPEKRHSIQWQADDGKRFIMNKVFVYPLLPCYRNYRQRTSAGYIQGGKSVSIVGNQCWFSIFTNKNSFVYSNKRL